MAKPKKNLFEQKSKKSIRNPQVSKMNSDDDEEVDDVMAWGRKRQNYYKQDEDEYSSLSEQEQQAQQIYKNKYENYMNDEDVYDIPEQKRDETKAQINFEPQIENDQEQGLPQEYVRQEIEWVLELFKDLEFYQKNNLLVIYQKLLKSYLTVIISIKQLKIPYIQYHPIIPMAVEIKTKITKLMKKLTVVDDQPQSTLKSQIKEKKAGINRKLKQDSYDQEDSQNYDDLEFDEEDLNQNGFEIDDDQESNEDVWDESLQQPTPKFAKKSNLKQYPDHCTQALKAQKQQHKKGIQFYNQMKAAHETEKKIKKQEKRQERMVKKKPAFKQLGQNEGRFASQLILKNKGLMKKRKKIEGNSRVKLRKKYQKKKAIHRARSGHFMRQNPGRAYEGESNIRTGKIAGVRLK